MTDRTAGHQAGDNDVTDRTAGHQAGDNDVTDRTAGHQAGDNDVTERTGRHVAAGPRAPRRAAWTRRRVLAAGLGSAVVLAGAGIAGLELVSRGVLPGRSMLDTLDGACSVASPPLAFSPLGPSFSGTFYSAARRRPVGYTIAYPPRHRPGDELPLVVMLLAEKYPHLIAAVAAISPAIWTSYPRARQANPAAYASAAAFAAGNVVTHAAALGRRPVRVAAGSGDPFYPGVQALVRALEAPGGAAVVDFGPGCHDDSFFAAQEPPSLAFLAGHLAG